MTIHDRHDLNLFYFLIIIILLSMLSDVVLFVYAHIW